MGSLSVNRCYTVNGIIRRDVQRWMNDLAWSIKGELQGERLEPPIKILLYGRFRDKRIPDLANLHKTVGDAVERGLGINDKHYLFEDLPPEIDRTKEPVLIITIEEVRIPKLGDKGRIGITDAVLNKPRWFSPKEAKK